MNKIIMLLAGLVALTGVGVTQANAAGCLRGAVAGGVIGHFAGHHGLLGAGVGCLYEHHRATERMRDEERYRRRY